MEKRNANKKLAATLLVVITVLGYALSAQAGNLEPSTGPGPTMKTLDEVEPRIPINSDNTPGDSSYEYRINSSGSYYLTGDVTTTKGGIEVTANDVTIDLMGYTLKGPNSGTNYGVYMDGRSNVEIRNGTVRDFYFGIYDGNTSSQNHRVIGVRAVSNELGGISLHGSKHLVKDCTASDNGDSATSTVCGIRVGNDGTVTGNIVCNNGTSATSFVYGIDSGKGSTVSGNTSSDNGDLAGNTVKGISTGAGSTVIGNTVYNNGDLATGDVYSILAGEGSTVTHNTSYDNGTSANGHVYGISVYSGSTVTHNTSYDNGRSAYGHVYGIEASGGCTVTDNTVCSNGFSAIGLVVFGISAGSGSTVTNNTVHDNGDAAGSIVYGIDLGGYNLVDQNTAYSNGTGARGPVTQITYGVSGCVYGINVPPAP